ncbi:hypothetical protein, partial [Klebsiella aerogenes]|uniref:hypothetical protein n=1 Tax=Klebsiella aerogenes TaxID=548 RepID=UPI001CC522E9
TKTSKETEQNSSGKTSVQLESGGSATRKADETSYRMISLANVKTSITSVFSQGGFNVADPEFVLSGMQLEALTNEFSKGNDVSASTLQ